MNYCCDCKWYKKTNDKHLCTSPNLGLDIVTGKLLAEDCYLVRNSYCGFTSVWFEAKK